MPWGPDGVSLDLMRRDRSADPGMNELLIVAALQAAPKFGITRVSLNFAMFRSALARGEKIGAGPVLRAWRGLLVFLSRWFQIESLYKFNAKFQPRWEPRFVVYRASARPAPHRLRRHAGRGLRHPRPAPAALPAPPLRHRHARVRTPWRTETYGPRSRSDRAGPAPTGARAAGAARAQGPPPGRAGSARAAPRRGSLLGLR